MSGARIAAKVASGIEKAGAKTGAGPLAGTIIRPGAADEGTYPPTPGSDAEFGCTVVFDTYSARDRDGTQITARDVKVLIAPNAATDPRNGDRLRIGAETYHLVNVDAVKPGGTILMWVAQARMG